MRSPMTSDVGALGAAASSTRTANSPNFIFARQLGKLGVNDTNGLDGFDGGTVSSRPNSHHSAHHFHPSKPLKVNGFVKKPR